MKMKVEELAKIMGKSIAEVEQMLKGTDTISVNLGEGKSRAAKENLVIKEV